MNKIWVIIGKARNNNYNLSRACGICGMSWHFLGFFYLVLFVFLFVFFVCAGSRSLFWLVLLITCEDMDEMFIVAVIVMLLY